MKTRIQIALVTVILIAIILFFAFKPHGDGHEHHTMVELSNESGVSVELVPAPAQIEASKNTLLNLYFISKEGLPAKLVPNHGRSAHMVILSNDFRVFGHIHPEDFDPKLSMAYHGHYPLNFTFPQNGSYLIAIDSATADGHFSSIKKVQVGTRKNISAAPRAQTSGCFKTYTLEAGDAYRKAVLLDSNEVSCTQGYNVTLSHDSLQVGKETELRYHLEQNGKRVDDFELYLEAPMHLAIARSDLASFKHYHGNAVERNGKIEGDFSADVVFDTPGTYLLVSQVKRGQEMIVVDFTLMIK